MKTTNISILFNQLYQVKINTKLALKYIRQSFALTLLLIPLVAIGLLSTFLYQSQNILSIQNFYLPKSVILNYINPLKPSTYAIEAGDFLANHYPNIDSKTKIPFELYKKSVDYYTNNQLNNLTQTYKQYSFLAFFLIFIGCSYWGYKQYQRDTKQAKKNLHKRGATLVTQSQMASYTHNLPHVLSIGNLNIPMDTECKHILVFGASGSGKSVLLSQFLNQLNTFSKQDKNPRHYIITDVKPEFVGKFAKPDDFIFCPFDKRSICWTIFDDVEDISDYDNFASILFEDSNAKDPFWGLAAASVFADGLKYLDLNGLKTNLDLLDFFNQKPEELQKKIKTLPKKLITSAQYLNAPEGNMISSILATLNSGLRPFQHLKDTPSDDLSKKFSFRKYIREEYKRTDGTIPNLYILVPSNKQRLMSPLLSLAMDILISESLTLPESKTCKLHFIVDEIGSLDKIQLLPDLITKGRSYGISIIALTQDPGLLKDKYGMQTMQSFLNNFGTQIVLRINDANTAKELADAFGVEEKVEYKQTLQLQQDGSITPSISQDKTTTPLVIASELQTLLPFHGYGKIVGYPPFKLTIPKQFFDKQRGVEHYVPIDKISISDFKRTSPYLKKDKSNTTPEEVLKKLKGEQ